MVQEPRLLRLEVRGSPDNEIKKKMITEANFFGISSRNVLLFFKAMIVELTKHGVPKPNRSCCSFLT